MATRRIRYLGIVVASIVLVSATFWLVSGREVPTAIAGGAVLRANANELSRIHGRYLAAEADRTNTPRGFAAGSPPPEFAAWPGDGNAAVEGPWHRGHRLGSLWTLELGCLQLVEHQVRLDADRQHMFFGMGRPDPGGPYSTFATERHCVERLRSLRYLLYVEYDRSVTYDPGGAEIQVPADRQVVATLLDLERQAVVTTFRFGRTQPDDPCNFDLHTDPQRRERESGLGISQACILRHIPNARFR